MASPCDNLKNYANGLAKDAEGVLRELRELGVPTTDEEKERHKELKGRYRNLKNLHNAIVQVYTMSTALGGCGGSTEDLEPFPQPADIDFG